MVTGVVATKGKSQKIQRLLGSCHIFFTTDHSIDTSHEMNLTKGAVACLTAQKPVGMLPGLTEPKHLGIEKTEI